MTDDTIIKLAREAGFDPETQTLPPFDGFIRRFAERVAAEERKSTAAEMERLRTLAATAEKWRGIASAKFGDGRTVQEIQREAAEVEREAADRWRYARKELLWREDGPSSIRWSMTLPMTSPDISAAGLSADSISACLDAAIDAAIRARGAAPKGGE